MRCPRCDADPSVGTRFCSECGLPSRPRCPRCRADLLPRAKLCWTCATPLTGQRPAPPSSDLQSWPNYTPAHPAEKILTSQSALEGERKQVIGLSADRKAFIASLADRNCGNEQILLDPALGHLMAVMYRHEGPGDHVMGDGIVGLQEGSCGTTSQASGSWEPINRSAPAGGDVMFPWVWNVPSPTQDRVLRG